MNKLHSMEYTRFCKSLHQRANSNDASAMPDWNNPISYFPCVPFENYIPLTAVKDCVKQKETNGRRTLNSWLSLLCGLSVGCHEVSISARSLLQKTFSSNLLSGVKPRRRIASGGASYPCELIVSLPEEKSLYRYAANYHVLAEQQENDLASMSKKLAIAITGRVDHNRTAFKYGNFAYRLAAVDAGFVLGRLLQISAVLDKACYVRLTQNPTGKGVVDYFTLIYEMDSNEAGQSKQLTGEKRDVSRAISKEKVHCEFSSSLQAATAQITTSPHYGEALLLEGVALQSLEHLKNTIEARCSKGTQYNGKPISQERVVEAIAQGLNCCRKLQVNLGLDTLHFSVYVSIINSTEKAAGLYRFKDGKIRRLPQKRFTVDSLAQTLLMKNIKLHQACAVVHFVADGLTQEQFKCDRYIQTQLLTGVFGDAFTLAISDESRSCHPLLGFDSDKVAQLYGYRPRERQCMLTLCVGCIDKTFLRDVPYE